MTLRELRSLWRSDLHRYEGKVNLRLFCKHLLANPGYKYTFWLRACQYFWKARPRPLAWLPYGVCRLLLTHYEWKFGISIPYVTSVGRGLYIGHFGGIVVNGRCTLGDHCNIHQGVTLGQANRGERKGSPALGNGVWLGPGSTVIGAITIGDNVAIGAHAVVTKDVPDNAVVVGMPGKIISYAGTEGYVEHVDV